MRPIALLLAFLLLAAGSSGAARDPLERKIAVMEKILDTTLIESENSLVYRGGVTEGVYLEGFGVLFKMEFNFARNPSRKILDNLGDLDSLKAYWRDMIDMRKKGSPVAALQREELNRIEDELVETLIEYGATLGRLGDEDRVCLAAFPWQDAWDVSPEPVQSLLITARYGDLRAYGEDRADADAVRARIEIVEVPE